MTVGKAIFYLLDNSTDLTAIVGTRIYPEVAQQDAPLPYVVYNISNNEPSDTKFEPSKLDTANIEVNCYSTSYTEVIDMAVAVRAALDRVTGTYNGVNVQSIAYMNEVIDFDEGQRAYNVSSDYDVRISRTDFEIAQGTPVTGVRTWATLQTYTTGVTDGQVIAYDAATAVWLPATDGGAQQLNDLSDVNISQPAQGEFFRYYGGEWVNDTAIKSDVGLGNVDNTSDANKPISTATQTALDLKADITSVPTELDDLNDVQIIGTPTLGQALVYGAGKWLPGAAGATELGDLDDVNTTGAGFGSLLTFNGSSWDISGSQLPTDDIYFHQRYETESEALRTGATATTELYFTCTAQGNGLAESASSDTPTAGNVINRKIYYSEAGFADPDTGTWVEFTPAPADDATFATVKAALLEYLKARTGGTVPISLKQTWEETLIPTLLLDTYTGAAAAYSLRKLRTAYTGDAINVWNGTSYADIGFDGDELDTTALAAHCVSNDGFIRYWYDQSGNTNTAEQTVSTANMPKIYDGTTGYLTGLQFVPASNNNLRLNNYTFDMTDVSAALVAKADNTGGYTIIDAHETTTAREFAMGVGNGTVGSTIIYDGNQTNDSDTLSNYDDLFLLTMFADSSTANDSYLNGQACTGTGGVQTTPNTTNNIRIGQRGSGSADFSGLIFEFVVWFSDQSTNRTGIEDNINTFYNIY
jgi:hypothetical protein